MNSNSNFFSLLFFFVLTFSFAGAEETKSYPNIQSVQYNPKLDLTEVKLRNGMHIIVKSTEYDQDEFFIQLIAPGGFNSLSKELRPTGRLAAEIVWASGVGTYKGDKLECMLYEYSIDLYPRIEGFSRQINGSGPSESLEDTLRVIKLIFTDPYMSSEGFHKIIANKKDAIRNRYFDKEQNFIDLSAALNTERSTFVKSMSIKGVDRVKEKEVEAIFKEAFSDPAEFLVIIIGDIKKEKTLQYVDQQLGTLAKSGANRWPGKTPPVSFPQGIKKVHLPGRNPKEAYSRMTFPLKVALNEENFVPIQMSAQFIEYRLRETLRKEMGKTYSVDTSLELPLYPNHSLAWLAIQFVGPADQAEKIEQLILKQMQSLQEQGPTKQEIDYIRDSQTSVDQFWLKDNGFWQSMIVNYYLWGWNPSSIIYDYTNSPYFQDGEMKGYIKQFYVLDNYTLLTADE